jgi:hypothetical protein
VRRHQDVVDYEIRTIDRRVDGNFVALRALLGEPDEPIPAARVGLGPDQAVDAKRGTHELMLGQPLVV